jgi:hypothetical protein
LSCLLGGNERESRVSAGKPSPPRFCFLKTGGTPPVS